MNKQGEICMGRVPGDLEAKVQSLDSIYFHCIVSTLKGLKQTWDVFWFTYFKKMIGCCLKNVFNFPSQQNGPSDKNEGRKATGKCQLAEAWVLAVRWAEMETLGISFGARSRRVWWCIGWQTEKKRRFEFLGLGRE